MSYRIITVAALSILLTGCETIAFYQQAIVGQSRLVLKRSAVESLIKAGGTDPELRYRLQLSRDAVTFASTLGLPSGKAFDSYVQTDQQFVVWNVFAAPALELRLETSCFPVAGCVSYRGYFKREDAEKRAALLGKQGYDVYVRGVAAYSTLGWFNDPMLDTFLFQEEEYLVALLFHELAHRMVYVKGDTRFNESFATTVERFALREWIISRGNRTSFDEYIASLSRRHSVIELINETRRRLHDLYASDKLKSRKLTIKSELIKQLAENYKGLKGQWMEGNEFSRWMSGEINNAKLETVADYNSWVPVMKTYLITHGMEAFALEMKRLASLQERERFSALSAMPILKASDNRTD